MIDEAEQACAYVVERVRRQAKSHWLQAQRKPTLVTSSAGENAQLLARRKLHGVPELAARGLVAWSDGRRRVRLYKHEPSPHQVLTLMASGQRCVSLLDNERGLDFVLHDLCHLEKFFSAEHYVGQVGFFASLARAIADPRFGDMESDLDAQWSADRDHVLADMNGSPLFLYCGLKSRLMQACERAHVDVQARIELLDRLLELDAHAAEVRSRRSSAEACEALAAHFASVGRAHLSESMSANTASRP